jgi:hypothetical protein
LPAPPQIPSGQCDGVVYLFQLSYVDANTGETIAITNNGGDFRYWGPVGGIEARKTIASDGTWTGSVIWFASRGAARNAMLPYESRLERPIFQADSASFVNLRREDGLPDNCGGNTPVYPPASAPSVNPRTYDHTGSDGISRPINYNINFPGVGISPTINFPDLPDIKIPVKIDATGIEVNIPVGIGVGEGGGGISEEDLEALLDAASKIPDIKEGIEDLMNGGNQSSDNKGEKEGEQEGYVPDIAGVIINVTEYPAGFGRKFGEPKIFDFGRVHFKRGNFYSQEIPLATVRQWCAASPESDGYAIFLRPGVKAEITVVKQEKENGG